MKVLCTDYTIDAADITITVPFPLAKESILLVTDVDHNEILYSFADPTRGGTLVGNVLTLDYQGSITNNTRLQIYCDDALPPASDETARTLTAILEGIAVVVANLDQVARLMSRSAAVLSLPDVSNRLRVAVESIVSVGIGSGTLNTVQSIGQSNWSCNDIVPSVSRIAADNLRRNITHS